MKTNLMKSILHLKDDTEYQIPLREADIENRAKAGTTTANLAVNAKKETEAEKAANEEKVNNEEEDAVTQSQADSTAKKKTDEISQEDVDDAERPALASLEEENPNPEDPSNTENSSNDTNTESVPQVDTAKAALDEMKKLASQEGVIHPSLFISNFSKILGLMERAMQLQVKESGSATKEAPKANEQPEQTEATEQTEIPAEGKQGELNGNTNNNRS